MATAVAIREAIKSLLDAGYVEVNVRGGKHRKFSHPRCGHWVTLPHRPKSDRLYGGLKRDIAIAIELGRGAQ